MGSKTEDLLVELLSDMKKRMEKLEEKVEALEDRQPTEIHNHYHTHNHYPRYHYPYWSTGTPWYTHTIMGNGATYSTSGTTTQAINAVTSDTATIKASDIDFASLESKAENSLSTF